MSLSSFIMLSTQLKCTFFPPSDCLEHKASALCVNQHIDRVEGYICTGGAELHLLYYNEFIVLKNPQKAWKKCWQLYSSEKYIYILLQDKELLTISERKWIIMKQAG